MIHPRAVIPIRFNHRAVPPEILTNILGFALLGVALGRLAQEPATAHVDRVLLTGRTDEA